jgi:hypothetical protein
MHQFPIKNTHIGKGLIVIAGIALAIMLFIILLNEFLIGA